VVFVCHQRTAPEGKPKKPLMAMKDAARNNKKNIKETL